MTPVPEGAQRSEDGYYWWDGTAWQQIPDDERVPAATGSDGTAASGEISHEELAQITHVDQIDDRSKPYFHPDPDMYPDDASGAESSDVLSDEPAPNAAGGN
jgi:hypothetical protein